MCKMPVTTERGRGRAQWGAQGGVGGSKKPKQNYNKYNSSGSDNESNRNCNSTKMLKNGSVHALREKVGQQRRRATVAVY